MDAMSLGSQAAYSRFFMHYRNKLFPFVRQIVKDDYLADEAVSKTLEAVCAKPLEFKGDAKFSTCLFSIARNKALSH